MPSTKKLINALITFFDDAPEKDEPIYDPAHLAGVLVVSLFAMGVLYWLLWALLVCEGGLPGKIGPLLQVVLTSKTLADFGYLGHPYALGVFEGWIVNLTALILSLALLAGGWWVFNRKEKK